MRCLKRNQQTVYYSTYVKSEVQYDTDHYETGEPAITYSAPTAIKVNVSPAAGRVNVELFGNDLSYDRVIVTDDMACPISETSILWVDSAPSTQVSVPHDYIVRKVAKSLNSITIAISRVDVS